MSQRDLSHHHINISFIMSKVWWFKTFVTKLWLIKCDETIWRITADEDEWMKMIMMTRKDEKDEKLKQCFFLQCFFLQCFFSLLLQLSSQSSIPRDQKQTDSRLPPAHFKVVEASFPAAAPLKKDSFFKKEEREREREKWGRGRERDEGGEGRQRHWFSSITQNR